MNLSSLLTKGVKEIRVSTKEFEELKRNSRFIDYSEVGKKKNRAGQIYGIRVFEK